MTMVAKNKKSVLSSIRQTRWSSTRGNDSNEKLTSDLDLVGGSVVFRVAVPSHLRVQTSVHVSNVLGLNPTQSKQLIGVRLNA